MTHAIHPVADLFPMLAEDELKELASDIAERGLLQPVVLDSEGRVLDGRNRLAACEIAGVEPQFTTFDGDDPDGYALAVNIARRHLTKGQIAMVAARARLVSSRSLAAAADEVGVSKGRVNQAAVVLDHAPDLADAVVSGATSLDEAYQTARENKAAAESEAQKIEQLAKVDRDLSVLVKNGMRSLDDALTESGHRKTVREIEDIRDGDGAPADGAFTPRVLDGSLTWTEAATLAEQWLQERDEAIERTQARLREVVSGWSAVQTVASNPTSPYVADVLEGLGDRDREEVQQIISTVRK